MSLSKRHKDFVDLWLNNGRNGTQAYFKCFKTNNENTARNAASKLLQKPDIVKYIESRELKLQKKVEITREMLAFELLDIFKNNKGKKDMVALKSVEMLAKLMGLNAAEKKEITHMTEQPLFSPLDIKENKQLEENNE